MEINSSSPSSSSIGPLLKYSFLTFPLNKNNKCSLSLPVCLFLFFLSFFSFKHSGIPKRRDQTIFFSFSFSFSFYFYSYEWRQGKNDHQEEVWGISFHRDKPWSERGRKLQTFTETAADVDDDGSIPQSTPSENLVELLFFLWPRRDDSWRCVLFNRNPHAVCGERETVGGRGGGGSGGEDNDVWSPSSEFFFKSGTWFFLLLSFYSVRGTPHSFDLIIIRTQLCFLFLSFSRWFRREPQCRIEGSIDTQPVTDFLSPPSSSSIKYWKELCYSNRKSH